MQGQPTSEGAVARVRYDVNAALGEISDGNRPLRERARLLFEFYVALLHCEGSAGGTTGFDIEVPEQPLRDARQYALMKLVGNADQAMARRLEEERFACGHVRTRGPRKYFPGPRRRTASAEAGAIHFRRMANSLSLARSFHEDGWRLAGAAEFEQKLSELWEEFASVAPLLDLSLRLDAADLGPRQRGGITMALEILADDPAGKRLGVKESRATLRRRWKRYEPVSVFSYLLALQGYERPRSLKTPGFAKHLLKMVREGGEQPTLASRRLIASYAHVRTKLRERHYTKLPALAVLTDDALPSPDVSIEPLPQDVRDAVVAHRRAAPGRG